MMTSIPDWLLFVVAAAAAAGAAHSAWRTSRLSGRKGLWIETGIWSLVAILALLQLLGILNLVLVLAVILALIVLQIALWRAPTGLSTSSLLQPVVAAQFNLVLNGLPPLGTAEFDTVDIDSGKVRTAILRPLAGYEAIKPIVRRPTEILRVLQGKGLIAPGESLAFPDDVPASSEAARPEWALRGPEFDLLYRAMLESALLGQKMELYNSNGQRLPVEAIRLVEVEDWILLEVSLR